MYMTQHSQPPLKVCGVIASNQRQRIGKAPSSPQPAGHHSPQHSPLAEALPPQSRRKPIAPTASPRVEPDADGSDRSRFAAEKQRAAAAKPPTKRPDIPERRDGLARNPVVHTRLLHACVRVVREASCAMQRRIGICREGIVAQARRCPGLEEIFLGA